MATNLEFSLTKMGTLLHLLRPNLNIQIMICMSKHLKPLNQYQHRWDNGILVELAWWCCMVRLYRCWFHICNTWLFLCFINQFITFYLYSTLQKKKVPKGWNMKRQTLNKELKTQYMCANCCGVITRKTRKIGKKIKKKNRSKREERYIKEKKMCLQFRFKKANMCAGADMCWCRCEGQGLE